MGDDLHTGTQTKIEEPVTQLVTLHSHLRFGDLFIHLLNHSLKKILQLITHISKELFDTFQSTWLSDIFHFYT